MKRTDIKIVEYDERGYRIDVKLDGRTYTSKESYQTIDDAIVVRDDLLKYEESFDE